MTDTSRAELDKRTYLQHDGTPLSASVSLPGAKHGFAHVLSSAAVANSAVLDNVPANSDAEALIDALRLIFSSVRHDRAAKRLEFGEPFSGRTVEWGPELAQRSRNLFCLMPAALYHGRKLRLGGSPAGCEIGARPSDWYMHTMREFGANISSENERLVLSWPRPRPAAITFQYPTMTGSVVALAASAAAEAASTIIGSTYEPSFREQAESMTRNGRPVIGLGDVIIGPGALDHYEWKIGPDRIHAVTLITAALLTRGEITISSTSALRIWEFIEFCSRIGAEVESNTTTLRVRYPANGSLKAIDLAAGPEPLFSSDWAPFAALLLACRSVGKSTISDSSFENRFQFLETLAPAGISNWSLRKVKVGPRTMAIVSIDGRPDMRIQGRDFGDTPDIRGSAAVLMSALVADGPCSIPRATHLRRGYEDLIGQLASLGVTGPVRS